MKERALINKFIGIWSTQKTCVWWINTTWKSPSHYDLQLGAKCFFMIIFFNEVDQSRIIDNRPYFFNSACIFLTPWKERFNSDKENLTIALVWICLYSLPSKYWKEAILIDIGNTLGIFVKVSEQTKQMRYTFYARICLYLDISKDLPDGI